MRKRDTVTVDKAFSEIAKEIAIRPHYDNWIGGKWVPAVRGQYFDGISPVDGHVICTERAAFDPSHTPQP